MILVETLPFHSSSRSERVFVEVLDDFPYRLVNESSGLVTDSARVVLCILAIEHEIDLLKSAQRQQGTFRTYGGPTIKQDGLMITLWKLQRPAVGVLRYQHIWSLQSNSFLACARCVVSIKAQSKEEQSARASTTSSARNSRSRSSSLDPLSQQNMGRRLVCRPCFPSSSNALLPRIYISPLRFSIYW